MRSGTGHVVVVGAGFAGLSCARELGRHNVRATIIDRQNYHLFVPLLYQVATAAPSPADIAEPVRKILRRYKSIDVRLGEVNGIDHERRFVLLTNGDKVTYDRLVVATGSRYNYFGHPEWEEAAPGIKSIADAQILRSRLLSLFEQAEYETNQQLRSALLTIVIVGGGPTGVEMAGAIAELARYTLARDFRHIDPKSAKIILIEAGERLLTAFPDNLAAYTHRRLTSMGVQVRLRTSANSVGSHEIYVDGELMPVGAVIWAAGIQASPVGAWLGVETDHIGRVPVEPDLSVAHRPGIYVLGDSARAAGSDERSPLPALAQVAKQQGAYVGRAIASGLGSRQFQPPFRFRNRGNTAVIGRNAAVFDFGRWRIKGHAAWLLWAVVHVYLLVSFEKRLLVSVQWLWRYFTYQRGARLITTSSPQISNEKREDTHKADHDDASRSR